MQRRAASFFRGAAIFMEFRQCIRNQFREFSPDQDSPAAAADAPLSAETMSV